MNLFRDAFDKVARLLHLPADDNRGPGAVLESYAFKSRLPPYDTQPLLSIPHALSIGGRARQIAFSFSGLVTAVGRIVHGNRGEGRFFDGKGKEGKEGQAQGGGEEEEGGEEVVDKIDESLKREVSRLFQDSATGHVVAKVRLAFESNSDLGGIRALVVSGGVACNLVLRKR